MYIGVNTFLHNFPSHLRICLNMHHSRILTSSQVPATDVSLILALEPIFATLFAASKSPRNLNQDSITGTRPTALLSYLHNNIWYISSCISNRFHRRECNIDRYYWRVDNTFCMLIKRVQLVRETDQ